VLDIQLGGMSGIELHRQIQASGSSTPVIYITAHDEPETREQAQATGCAAYFRKTAPGQDVLRAIRKAAHPKEPERS
jgi:DNA-binding NarL/FixJ family response regulator